MIAQTKFYISKREKDRTITASNMVRVKNRYLLVNILYPDSSGSFPSAKVPDLVSFYQPTTDMLDAPLLIKAIREETSALFGDYGTGAVAESLASKFRKLFCQNCS